MDEAFGILCLSISPELLFYVESCSTPNEVWKILERLFGEQDEIWQSFLFSLGHTKDPQTYAEVDGHPQWEAAMDEELFSPFFNGNLLRSSASTSSKLLFENIEVQKSSSIFAADSSPVSKFAEKKTGDPIKVEPEIEFGTLTGLKSVEAMSPAAGLSSLASEPNVAISKPLKIESSSIKEGDGLSLSTPDKQSKKVIHDSVFPVSIQRKSNSSDCGRPATATERAPPVHAAIQFESRGISRNDLSRPLENEVSEVAATSFDHCTSKKVVRLFGVERKGRDVRVRSQDIAGPRGRGRGPGKESERSHLQHQPLLRDHLAHLDRPPDTGPRKGRRQHQVSAGGGRLGDLPGGHHVPGALSPEVQCPLRGAHGQDSARGHLQQDEHITGIWDSIRKPFSYGHVEPPRHLKAALDDVLKDKYYKIVKGLSAALLYLHEEWEETVVHMGVTASNVFLDADLSPRLGGFALAEFVAHGDNDHHATGAVRGIFGYMSPEYVASGRATTVADVFSFGVVVLEVVSGRMAVDFRFPAVLLVDKIRQFDKKERLEYMLVYEYMPRGDLECLLYKQQNLVLPWERRLGVALDCAEGLAYLHLFPGGAIVHRDIKPTNILLNESGQAKLSDFGISKLIAPDFSHASTEIKGTTGYLDPEYFTHGKLTEASDVYSFGIVLLQLISGQKAVVNTPSGGAKSVVYSTHMFMRSGDPDVKKMGE